MYIIVCFDHIFLQFKPSRKIKVIVIKVGRTTVIVCYYLSRNEWYLELGSLSSIVPFDNVCVLG